MFDALNIQFQQVNNRDVRFRDDTVQGPLSTGDDPFLPEREAVPFVHLAAKLQE